MKNKHFESTSARPGMVRSEMPRQGHETPGLALADSSDVGRSEIAREAAALNPEKAGSTPAHHEGPPISIELSPLDVVQIGDIA